MKAKSLIVLPLLLAACGPSEAPVDQVDRIASEFLRGYFTQHPEQAYESAFPEAPPDRLGDYRKDRVAAWNRQVDDWLDKLNAIDPAAIAGTPAAVTYLFALDRLQAVAGMRVCRMELWNISPTWTGWQTTITSTLALQAVDTADARAAALRRAADIERYLDTEVENLKIGSAAGYLAPQTNVDAVIGQLSTLIDVDVDNSPFFDPARRSRDADFEQAYREVLEERVVPSLTRYRDFLADEYRGREAVGVASNPDGEECYNASVHYWSSLRMDPTDIHRAGLSNMSRIQAEMAAVASESFGTDDLRGLLEQLRSDPRYTFESEADMLAYVNAAVSRAEAAMPEWFAHVPASELSIVPAPAFEKDSGGGFYTSAAADGSRGIYKVGTYNPTGISKAGTESTAFHESWPGHHLDASLSLGNPSLHPILRYMWSSGTSEGWALYSERLADEIGLYSNELSRLGMLSNEAFRAARLVVDPGMHVLGWSRQDAIDYLLENTAEGYDSIAGEVDRYLAVPGQATAYLLGSLEIQRLRRLAETRLGERFDIRVFHNRILSNGSVTLPMLGMSIEAWINETIAK